MIQLRHVYKTYPGPVHALRDLEMSVGKGEFTFLTGPSGAGKTTLFKILSAYDRPTSGSVEVFGYNLSTLTGEDISKYRQRIGVVFQDFKLLKDRTIYENVALPLLIRRERESVIKRKTLEALGQVGLTEKRDQYPEFISGGEQQRAAIARAIIHQPSLLIADEPTGNLDPDLAEEIMNLFERVSTSGTTIIVATHDIAMVERRGHRRISLKHGQAIKQPISFLDQHFTRATPMTTEAWL